MALPTLLRTASKPNDFTSPGSLSVDLTGAHAILVVAAQDATADASFSFTGCSISGSPGLVFSAGTEVIWNTNTSRRRAFWLTSGSIPSGAQTIQVTWTGGRRGGFVVYVFNDAGSSPAITIAESAPVAAFGTNTTYSYVVSPSTAAAECLAFVVASCWTTIAGTPVVGTGGTTAAGIDNTSLVNQHWLTKPGAASSTTLNWTYSAGNNNSLFGFSITGSSGGGGLSSRKLLLGVGA